MVAVARSLGALYQALIGTAQSEHLCMHKNLILEIQDAPGFYISGVTENGLVLTEFLAEARVFSKQELQAIIERFGDKLSLNSLEVRQ